MTSRFDILAIDAQDPRRLADFWCAVLDYAIVESGDGGVSIAGGAPPSIDFLPVAQTDVGQPDDATWVVLADPEGNEFCLLRSP